MPIDRRVAQFERDSADLSCRSTAFSFKASRSRRLANARGQLPGHRASGRAEDARALLRQIYNTEGPVSRRPKQNLGRAPAPSDAGGE